MMTQKDHKISPCAVAKRLIMAVLMVLPVAACGFHSMYGGEVRGPSVVERLSQVKLGTVSDPAGNKEHLAQMVHNHLLDALDATGPEVPRYRLDVKVTLDSQNVGYRPDNVITRVNLRLNADYALINLATGKPVFVNQASAFNAYDVVQSEFATMSARDDAERRLIPDLTDQIMTRLGLYFKYGPKEVSAPLDGKSVKSDPKSDRAQPGQP